MSTDTTDTSTTSTPRDCVIIYLHGSHLRVKRDKMFVYRPEHAQVLKDKGGVGHLWLGTHGGDVMFVMEPPGPRSAGSAGDVQPLPPVTMIDVRLVMEQCGAMMQKLEEAGGQVTVMETKPRGN